MIALSVLPECLFQSTLPCGSDTGLYGTSGFVMNFNPRSLAGATASCQRRDFADINFNPRSLAGATCSSSSWMQALIISIHAPLRERHGFRHAVAAQAEISIHAPLRERPAPAQHRRPCRNFNPRSLAGATPPRPK